jgi:hypothetical protein
LVASVASAQGVVKFGMIVKDARKNSRASFSHMQWLYERERDTIARHTKNSPRR